MLSDLFTQIGLSEDGAAIYSKLLKTGDTTAGELLKNVDYKRGTLYNILNYLTEKGLVTTHEKNKVTHFRAEHPEKLKEVFESHKESIERAGHSLSGVIPNLVAEYNLNYSKPAVLHFEGVEGLKRVHQDIIDCGEEVMFVRSIYDSEHNELDKLLKKQINSQVKKGMAMRAVTPAIEGYDDKLYIYDGHELFSRRIVERSNLSLPAQIIVFGTKVAITDMKDRLVTTVIENENINKTFRVLFEYLWTTGSEPES